MKKLTQFLAQVFCCLAVVMWSMSAYGQGYNTVRPKGSTSSPYGYLEYLPLDYYKNSNDYPVIIFLHGVGEKGSGSKYDMESKRLEWFGPSAEIESGRDFPFIILTPQSTEWWNPDDINKFIEFVKTKYRANDNKFYLTGMSMGAMGTYDYASKYPQQLAAVVPIAGKGNTSTICNMTNVPVWHFHGGSDGSINVEYARKTISAYNACSPTPSPLAKLTVYSGYGHDVWTRTYNPTKGYDIYSWMLQHSRGTVRTTNQAPTVSAGSNKTLTLPTNSTSLAGSASDSDGSIASVSWSKVSGPSCSMSGTTTKTLALSGMAAGTYTFRLTAKDNDGASKYDDVLVTVNSSTTTSNTAPTVNAGSNKTLTLPTNSTSIAGTATDSDGTIASVSWSKVSGPSCSLSGTTSKTLGVSSMSAGTYIFRLTAKDNDGASKYDDVQVTVNSSTTSSTGLVAPSNAYIKYNSTYNTASINWTDNSSNETGFEIYMSTGNNYTFKLIATTGTNASRYVKSGYTKGQKYYFKVRAKKSSTYSSYTNTAVLDLTSGTTANTDNSSDDSSTSSPSGLSAPASAYVKYNSTYNSASINWTDKSSNESGFEIFMSIGNNYSYKQIGSTGANATRYVKSGYTLGKRYYFKIRAKNSKGNSAYSNEVVLNLTTRSSSSLTASEEESSLNQSQLSLYPNPAQDWAEVSFGNTLEGPVSLQLLNGSGKVLLQQQVDASQQAGYRLDLQQLALAPGLYFIQISQGQQKETLKLLKQ